MARVWTLFQRLAERLEARLQPVFARFQISVQWVLLIAASVIGVIAGVGAIAFKLLINALETFSFQVATWLGEATHTFATHYHAFADFPWWLKIAIPTVGAAAVGPLTYFFAREAKGHGVPEVMDAVARKGGVIRKRVAAVKTVTSAISIGTGMSLGSEGPIAHIGASFGSGVGQLLRLGPEQMRLLVACGAAGGIAAVFNAPIAGMFFAMEIILADFAIGAMSALVLSSVVATIVSRAAFGNYPAFKIPPHFTLGAPLEIVAYIGLGIAAGAVAVSYTRMLYLAEDTFDRMKRVPEWAQPMIGGVMVGAIGIWVPHVFGVGYNIIDLIFLGKLGMGFLAFLVVAKMAATSISLGSGSSGGVFAPSLVMGSALGGSFGLALQHFFPTPIEPGAYAVVGMAAVVAATTHAPITAMLIVFEMTDGYEVILPLMVSCAIATMISRWLSRESIYSLKLARRGVVLAGGREESILRSMRVANVMRTTYESIARDMPFDRVVDIVLHHDESEYYVVDNSGRLLGTINLYVIKDLIQETGLGPLVLAHDVMMTGTPFLTPEMSLADSLKRLTFKSIEQLPVVASENDQRILGTLSRQDVIDTYNREILRMSAHGLRMIQHSGHGDHHRHVDLQPGFETREIPVRGRLVGKTLATLNLRANFGINCVAVKEGGRESTFEDAVPDPREVLKDGDVLVCIGTKDQLAKLAEGDVEAGLETREIAVGGALTGKTLAGLNMRAEYGLNCVAIKPADPAGGPTTIFPEPGRVLADGDILICSGYDEQFEKFSAAQKY